jgi:hypothetical protein
VGPVMSVKSVPILGLRENLPQCALLVLVNAFLGAMVGLDCSIRPYAASAGARLEADPCGSSRCARGAAFFMESLFSIL